MASMWQDMAAQQLMPPPDIHAAFVLLRRDPDQLTDDRFIVVCPACHYGDLGIGSDLGRALADAMAHRLSYTDGSVVREMLGL